MAAELVRQLRERLGDPEEALRKQQRLNEDARLFFAKVDEWRRQHPNRWVAVYGGELVAVADTREAVLAAVAEKGLPIEEVLVGFVSEEPSVFVLRT